MFGDAGMYVMIMEDTSCIKRKLSAMETKDDLGWNSEIWSQKMETHKGDDKELQLMVQHSTVKVLAKQWKHGKIDLELMVI